MNQKRSILKGIYSGALRVPISLILFSVVALLLLILEVYLYLSGSLSTPNPIIPEIFIPYILIATVVGISEINEFKKTGAISSTHLFFGKLLMSLPFIWCIWVLYSLRGITSLG